MYMHMWMLCNHTETVTNAFKEAGTVEALASDTKIDLPFLINSLQLQVQYMQLLHNLCHYRCSVYHDYTCTCSYTCN